MGRATITVPGRFCGPDASANGGYASGAIAEVLGGAAQVELRQPPPLESPMAVDETPSGLEARHEDSGVILRARALGEDEPDVDVPEPVTLAQARAAAERYVGFERHPFPRCFTCGPRREVADGLRIFPGQLAGRAEGTVAAPWQPHEDVADDRGRVATPVVWASLDCPTGFTAINDDEDAPPFVLARFAVRIGSLVRAGEPYVVMAWPVGGEGRKHHAASALLNVDGTVLAVASALWIQLRPDG